MSSEKEGEGMIHLIAGGLGGTMGSVITCPLEVIKVRLQSSEFASASPSTQSLPRSIATSKNSHSGSRHFRSQLSPLFHNFPSTSHRHFSSSTSPSSLSIISLLRKIVAEEGFRALWKGALPNILGVAPSKAIYFYAYSNFKRILSPENGHFLGRGSEAGSLGPAGIHMLSAGAAGFITASCVNPVWLMKTRLQLSHKSETLSCVARGIWKADGWRGFYRGVTASYVGIGETVVQFVIYEYLRELHFQRQAEAGKSNDEHSDLSSSDFASLMVCAGVAKLCATVSMYPHEVCRTRMREAGSKHKSFFKTLVAVYSNEGWRALYGGIHVHLIRAIPNTAVVMGTYELVVYLLRNLAHDRTLH